MRQLPACVKNLEKPRSHLSRSRHTLPHGTPHPPVALECILVIIAPVFSLISPSSRHLFVVVASVRPSRTHRRLHPIRYHVSQISFSYILRSMHSSAQVPLLHRRAPTAAALVLLVLSSIIAASTLVLLVLSSGSSSPVEPRPTTTRGKRNLCLANKGLLDKGLMGADA